MIVSIIMPAYNAAPFIGEAIESVRAQTWSDWELIVVDDGSTDGTAAILDRIKDPRIKVIYQENRGVGAARNAALEVAAGEYITFLDADDMLPPSSVEVRLNSILKNRQFDIIGGVVSINNSSMSHELWRRAPNYSGPFVDKLVSFDKDVFATITYLVKAEKIRNIKFLVGLKNGEDLLFWIESSVVYGLQYTCINDLVYVQRNTEGSASKNLKSWAESMPVLVDNVEHLDGLPHDKKKEFRRRVSSMLIKYSVKTINFPMLMLAIEMRRRAAKDGLSLRKTLLNV